MNKNRSTIKKALIRLLITFAAALALVWIGSELAFYFLRVDTDRMPEEIELVVLTHGQGLSLRDEDLGLYAEGYGLNTWRGCFFCQRQCPARDLCGLFQLPYPQTGFRMSRATHQRNQAVRSLNKRLES